MKGVFSRASFLSVGVLAFISIGRFSSSAQDKKGQFSTPGYTQRTPSKPLPDGGPAPRLAGGHPDFSGVWFKGSLGKEDATLVGSFGVLDPNQKDYDPKTEEKPSFQPWAAAKVEEEQANLVADTRDPSSFDKLPREQKIAALNVEILKLSRNCMPHGVPGIVLNADRPFQFVSAPGIFVQLDEHNHDYRVVNIDGRSHTKDPDPKFNGESLAHWEGDTLVIDTIAIDERVWNSEQWTFHSDQEHVIERITRPSMNYLTYQVTIEDPKVLTKPWNSAVHKYSLGHESLLEWYCGVNGHDDEELQALKAQRDRLQAQK
jgi:hypothetical protein